MSIFRDIVYRRAAERAIMRANVRQSQAYDHYSRGEYAASEKAAARAERNRETARQASARVGVSAAEHANWVGRQADARRYEVWLADERERAHLAAKAENARLEAEVQELVAQEEAAQLVAQEQEEMLADAAFEDTKRKTFNCGYCGTPFSGRSVCIGCSAPTGVAGDIEDEEGV